MTKSSMRWGTVLMGVLATVAVWAPATRAVPRSREMRAMLRCQHAVSRESVGYSNTLGWKVSRCLRMFDECRIVGDAVCSAADAVCREAMDDASDMERRLRSRVSAACSGLTMDALMNGLGYGEQLDGCEPTTVAEFAECLVANLRAAQGDLFARIEPKACATMRERGTSAPVAAEFCSMEECQPTGGGGDDTCEGTFYCGGAENVACPDGMVCDRHDALCSESADGMCVPAPASACEAGSAVCGCDGTTYPSDCDRLAAGVTKAGDGTCMPAGQDCGAGRPDCPSGMFCEYEAGTCGEGLVGTCRPMAMPGCDLCAAFVGGTQCGCDGMTYANTCARAAAGTSKWYDGPC